MLPNVYQVMKAVGYITLRFLLGHHANKASPTFRAALGYLVGFVPAGVVSVSVGLLISVTFGIAVAVVDEPKAGTAIFVFLSIPLGVLSLWFSTLSWSLLGGLAWLLGEWFES